MTPSNSMWRTTLPHVMGQDDEPDAATAMAYTAAVADPTVRKLAMACASALKRLIEQGGFEHYLAGAVMGAAILENTPADWLQVQLGNIQAELGCVTREREVAKLRRHAARDKRKPLAEAVSHLSTRVSAERGSLLRQLDAARQPGAAPKKSRWQELRDAGLSERQIAGLKLDGEPMDDEQRIHEMRNRLQVLNAQLAKCAAYTGDPLHDPAHVRGLGFDHLVDAQLGVKAVPA